ncbi:hypothetical protein [Streptomyces sp. RKND-216]|uniref:hypothetical protein n=1 Tax=Streptomyces sp. RKND-216 TaxID=2562581 RepID=UPI001447177E|nr:hypothetical protein [Streptomyces sp. RKND-216]
MHTSMEPRHGTMSLPDLFDRIVPEFPVMSGVRGILTVTVPVPEESAKGCRTIAVQGPE